MGDVVAKTALETVADGRDRAPPLLGLAEDGLIASQGAVWSPGGRLLASGATQLFCAPRPERFR